MSTSPRRGEVYEVEWRPARGHEQSGLRPAVVVQNDIGNRFSPTTIVVAVTSRPPKKPYPFEIEIPDGVLPKPSWANCAHLYTIDKRRLGRLMGVLPGQSVAALDDALRASLGLASSSR
ncbi:MAG TPA: type II toxin-antitoxin system PemK/MazF family toxin [Thermoleophilia bacterium]|nr:type II toxin-antitoxin system PemK/MazF family toxin [Thermoleophilia bacterium]